MYTAPLVFCEDGARRVLRALYPIVASDAPTTWIHVAMEGTWRGHPRGEFTLNRSVFDQIVANYSANPGPIPLDFEHSTEFAIPAPAAGWVQGVEVRDGANGAELWALVELCAKAAEFIRAGEYRFSSAVLDFEARDLVSGEPIGVEMTSLALTNVPFLRGQTPIALSQRGARALANGDSMSKFSKETLARALEMIEGDEISMEQLEAAAALASAAEGKSEPEPDKEPKADKPPKAEPEKPKDEPAALSAPAALAEPPPADAPAKDPAALLAEVMAQTGMTAEQICDALEQMAKNPAAYETPLSAGATDAEKVLLARVNETNKALSTRLAAAEKQLREYAESEAAEEVDILVKSGRILDLARGEMQALYLSNRKTFDAVAAGLPQVVPVGDHASALTPPTADTPAINEEDPVVKQTRRWLNSAGVSREKQDARIRKDMAARNGTRI